MVQWGERISIYKYLSPASTLLGATPSVCLIEGARATDMTIYIYHIKSQKKYKYNRKINQGQHK